MTLLVMAQLPGALVLASDQLLTDLATGKPLPNRANKAIADTRNWTGTAYAYTGVARIGRTPTDEWLTRVMGERENVDEAISLTRDRLTEVFAQMPRNPERNQLLIVGMAWARLHQDIGLEPVMIRISNIERGEELLPLAEDKFTAAIWQLGERPETSKKVWSAGQYVPTERLRGLEVTIARRIRRNPHPFVAAQLITEEIRGFARENPRVGKGVLVMVIPRPGADYEPGIAAVPPPRGPRTVSDWFGGPMPPEDMVFILRSGGSLGTNGILRP